MDFIFSSLTSDSPIWTWFMMMICNLSTEQLEFFPPPLTQDITAHWNSHDITATCFDRRKLNKKVSNEVHMSKLATPLYWIYSDDTVLCVCRTEKKNCFQIQFLKKKKVHCKTANLICWFYFGLGETSGPPVRIRQPPSLWPCSCFLCHSCGAERSGTFMNTEAFYQGGSQMWPASFRAPRCIEVHLCRWVRSAEPHSECHAGFTETLWLLLFSLLISRGLLFTV